jgi:hypothetical protein
MKSVNFFILSLLLAGCQQGVDIPGPGQDRMTVTSLYAGQQCGYHRQQPRVTWLDDRQQLAAVIKRIQGDTLARADTLPDADFDHEIVLLVEMGEKPTAGYRIEIGEPGSVTVNDATMRLVLDWLEPAAGDMLAQVVSSPCLLLKVARGAYQSVQILDRRGKVMAGTE